jgi:hypothetical protein
MNSILIACISLLGFAIAGCSSMEANEAKPVTLSNAPVPAESTARALEPFPYRAYPKEVLVEYVDRDALARAKAQTKAKGLQFWDEGILEQYKADIAVEMERIFSPHLGKGIEVIRASPVVPQVTLRLLNKEALEWLRSHPEIKRIWLDANPSYIPAGGSPAAQ